MERIDHNKKMDLIKKYNVKGSYYTAYPPAGLWLDKYESIDYQEGLCDVFVHNEQLPIQLYIHVPFCNQQCWYCQCFQVTTHDKNLIQIGVDSLIKEIRLLFNFINANRLKYRLVEIHLGGGSPTHLTLVQFDQLIHCIQEQVDLSSVAEFAVEIDPRTVDRAKLEHYSRMGINRVSLGVQEFNPQVQKAINRIQPLALIENLLMARALFKGVNFDLLYGLPLQTRESLLQTLREVIRLSPDRVAFSILGYRPDVFKHNRMIKETDLPSLQERTEMWEDSLNAFLGNGYERIGMDHFAKSWDALAIAKREKRHFRNSMGYSPGRFQDNLSVGPSGMIRLKQYYFQNTYSLSEYSNKVEKGMFPIVRGYKLNIDDMLRRDIMNSIMTYYRIEYVQYENNYKIKFAEYFKLEIDKMKAFVDEGIVDLKDNVIEISPLGRLFLRNICALFDNLHMEYKHNIETGLKAEC